MRDFELPGRSPVYAANGMIATTNPQAALTAVEILRAGGNAMDAAIAGAAVLSVTEPYNMGIGGDVFVLYAPATQDDVLAYNGSGYAPLRATAAWYAEHGMAAIPAASAHAVTIPGAVDAWVRLNADHGRKSLEELLEPAITLAEDGYPVSDVVSYYWQQATAHLKRDPAAAAIFLPGGRAPARGSLHRQPALACTLRRIGREGRAVFYEGAVAQELVDRLQQAGGLHSLEDFALYRGEYVTPIQTDYRGYDIFECPPNGQGIAALLMLNVLAGFRLNGLDPACAQRLHLEVEAARLAYRDRDLLIGDSAHHPAPVQELLSEAYAAYLRGQVDPHRALGELPESPFPRHSDTTYISVIDRDRNAVSFIGSLFHSFGSGIAGLESGVVLHNRGFGFRTAAGHPNAIGPRKRPLHTIIPGMARKDGRTALSFGVVGGRYQPLGHAHVLSNIIDFGLDLQEAVDLGRVYPEDGLVQVERGIADRTAMDLAGYGHQVVRRAEAGDHDGGPIGAASIVGIDWQAGMLIGAADPRTDGCALGY
ncbi:MAG TPA: gamma-glutamyltransferase family protein [Dongiaceae bacterium]|nr:gamma-glutamyltransferase family protein [Dongiaceae bacterium]